MNLQDITYDNKATMNENASIPAINKVQASDMNQIKEAINNNNSTIETTLLPVELYSGSTNSTATLTESIENYKRVKVYALNSDNVSVCVEIYNNNSGQASATLQTSAVGGSDNYVYSATVTFNNASASLSRKSVTRIRNNNTSIVSSLDTAMTIIRIVGFKY